MSLENASLIVTPNAYKAGKLYSVIPQDGSGDFTASRATTATRVNENGLIESVAVNVPRIDYTNGNCPSILAEGQATNLLLYSEDFTNAAWAKISAGTGVDPVVTSNAVISPDGTQNADEIVFNTQTGTSSSDQSLVNQSVSFPDNNDGTASIYLRGQNGGEQLSIRGLAGSAYQLITLTTEWQRFKTSENSGTSVNQIVFGIRQGLSGLGVINSMATIYAWGAQLEEGTEASSYIPTTNSQVTRNADVLSNNLTSVLQPTYTAFLEITANNSRLKVEDVDTGFDIPLNGTGKIVMVVDSQITFYFPDNGQPQTTLVYEKPDDFRDLEILSKLNSNSIKLLAIENGVATQAEINNFVTGDITSYFIETDWGSDTSFNREFQSEDWEYFPIIDTSNVTDFTRAWRSNQLNYFPLLDVSSGTNFIATWQSNNLTSFPLINVSNANTFEDAWFNNNNMTDFPPNMFDNLTNPAVDCFNRAWLFNSMNAQAIENILVSIDTSGANAPASGKDIDITSDGSALTTAATTAVANLKTKGWTIKIDGVIL